MKFIQYLLEASGTNVIEKHHGGDWMTSRGRGGPRVRGNLAETSAIIDGKKESLLWGIEGTNTLPIKSRSQNARLSNFSVIGEGKNAGMNFDGIYVRSLEGALQGVKHKDPELQKENCKLAAHPAWSFGRENDQGKWKQSQLLYWKGKPMKREGPEYQKFLTRLFDAVYLHHAKNRNALLLSADFKLVHSGNSSKKDTVLTEKEFLDQLNRLRKKVQSGYKIVNVDFDEKHNGVMSRQRANTSTQTATRTATRTSKSASQKTSALKQPSKGANLSANERLQKAIKYVSDDLADGMDKAGSIEDAIDEYGKDLKRDLQIYFLRK